MSALIAGAVFPGASTPLTSDPTAPAVLVMLADAPPAQPAVESPRTATALPQVLTGTLTGALTCFPLPTCPPLVVFPLEDARAEAVPADDGLAAAGLAAAEPAVSGFVVEVTPPLQPAPTAPSRAPVRPQSVAGMLTGRPIWLLLSTETLPDGLPSPAAARATPGKPAIVAVKPGTTAAPSAPFAVHCAHGRMGTPCLHVARGCRSQCPTRAS